MQLSELEAAILFVLEGEQRSLTHIDLSISLKKKYSFELSHQELYDYAESLKEKNLVRVNPLRSSKHVGFAGLRITGEGRNILNALQEQRGQMQEPVKNPIGFRREKN
ncbi:MAG: hypothetical protein OXC18_19270 [Desulfurellaceae bacterium]|nr:hypothetical protein [Desulfurellaceae bacterium]